MNNHNLVLTDPVGFGSVNDERTGTGTGSDVSCGGEFVVSTARGQGKDKELC